MAAADGAPPAPARLQGPSPPTAAPEPAPRRRPGRPPAFQGCQVCGCSLDGAKSFHMVGAGGRGARGRALPAGARRVTAAWAAAAAPAPSRPAAPARPPPALPGPGSPFARPCKSLSAALLPPTISVITSAKSI